MKRQDTIAVIAELEHITNDVRDLEQSPSRAAALQCLADARAHLLSCVQRDKKCSALASAPPSRDSEYGISGRAVELFPSVPPSCADNARVRNKATEAFRNARKLLSCITLAGIAEREHEKLLDEQAEGRK